MEVAILGYNAIAVDTRIFLDLAIGRAIEICIANMLGTGKVSRQNRQEAEGKILVKE